MVYLLTGTTIVSSYQHKHKERCSMPEAIWVEPVYSSALSYRMSEKTNRKPKSSTTVNRVVSKQHCLLFFFFIWDPWWGIGFVACIVQYLLFVSTVWNLFPLYCIHYFTCDANIVCFYGNYGKLSCLISLGINPL